MNQLIGRDEGERSLNQLIGRDEGEWSLHQLIFVDVAALMSEIVDTLW